VDERTHNQLVQKGIKNGYDVKNLHERPQEDPLSEAEQSHNDIKGIWWINSLFGK